MLGKKALTVHLGERPRVRKTDLILGGNCKEAFELLFVFWFYFFTAEWTGSELLHLAESCQHPTNIFMTIRMAFYFSQFHNVHLRKS